MSNDIIRLGVGLVILIVVNIILGGVDAILTGAFDKVKLIRGIAKGIIVALCFMATYMVGWLNPDVVAISVNGEDVNLLTGVYMVCMAGFLFYAAQVTAKLAAFIKAKVQIGEKELPGGPGI